MANTQKKNSKVSANIPSNAATTQAGSEVAVNPPANPVAGAGQTQSSSQSGASGSVSEGGVTITSGDLGAIAMATGIATILAMNDALKGYVDLPVAGSKERLLRPAATVLGAMDAAVQLLRVRPALAVNVNLTELAANADRVRAGLALASALRVIAANVEGTNTVNGLAGWADIRSVYRTAKPEAEGDSTIAEGIVPLAALFVRSKKTVAAVQNAALETLKSTNASTRATTAETRATAVRQRASALVPGVTITRTGDATITQPATAAPVSATAPSATAPAATPGTPGSITIR